MKSIERIVKVNDLKRTYETIKRVVKKMEWISIKDRLPEFCDSVMIWSPHMIPTVAYLLDDCICWIVNDWDEYDGHISFRDVTHWMPLPEPPTEML